MKNRTDPAWCPPHRRLGIVRDSSRVRRRGQDSRVYLQAGQSLSMRTGSRMRLTIRGPVLNICAYERDRQLARLEVGLPLTTLHRNSMFCLQVLPITVPVQIPLIWERIILLSITEWETSAEQKPGRRSSGANSLLSTAHLEALSARSPIPAFATIHTRITIEAKIASPMAFPT